MVNYLPIISSIYKKKKMITEFASKKEAHNTQILILILFQVNRAGKNYDY